MSASIYGARHCRIALATLLLASTAPSAQAQRLADLPAGTRLRVRTAEIPRWREGMLDTLTADSLALRSTDQRLVVARARIFALQVRDTDAHSGSHALDGALYGVLAGLAFDGASVYVCKLTSGQECGLGGLVIVFPAALLGAVVGGLIGASIPADRWSAVEP